MNQSPGLRCKSCSRRALGLTLFSGLTALSGCVEAQAPASPPASDVLPANVVSTVARRVSYDPQLQETPSVLLPGIYYDSSRTPLTAGAMAPDFTLPLASDCRWQPSGSALIQRPGRRRELTLSRLLKHSAATPSQTKPGAGRSTVLIFWAFWCDTWKDVTRDFKKLRPQLTAMGANVLCVAVDASQQPVARRAFAANEIWFPVVIDTHGGAGRGHAPGLPVATSPRTGKKMGDAKLSIGATFGVRRVPTFFVLDQTGKIHTRFEGFPGSRRFLQAVRNVR